jgi:assimilatory nitrate reductase catalytic subunit
VLWRGPQHHLQRHPREGPERSRQVTACLKAGGNCGSCVPEIKKLLVEIKVQAAADAQEGATVS